MSKFDINALTAAIGRHLRAHRASVMREGAIHDAIAAAFSELGIKVEREYRLTPKDRLDFFIPDEGIVVEVKKATVGLTALSQVAGYFESEKVTRCILIGMRIDPKIPSVFQGKAIDTIPLWKFLL